MAGGGQEGTIDRARPDDRIYRIADGRFSALNIRDVRAGNAQARDLSVGGRQKAPVDVAPESSRYKHKFIAEFRHVKAANSKSLCGVVVDGRVNIIKALEAGGFLTITGTKVSYRALAA